MMLGGAQTGLHKTGSSGPRVLLSHCSLAHSGAWRGMLSHLGEVRAEALDLPGHGKSETDHTRRPRRQAADAMLEVLGDGPAHLVGHSFGCRRQRGRGACSQGVHGPVGQWCGLG